MFGLFSDYKTSDQIDTIFAVKKLKTHYICYSSLIGQWEKFIVDSIGELGRDEEKAAPWIQDWQASEWSLKEMQREMSVIEENGIEERINELEDKMKTVEMMLGNRMVKKQFAEKEIALCSNTAETVKNCEVNVKNLRRKLKKYPKRMGILNQKVGSRLLRRRRMQDVLDILEVIRPTSLLGCSSKKQIVRLIKEQDWKALEPQKFHNVLAVKRGVSSLRSKIIHFQKEMRDEFCQLFQKPSFQTMIGLMEYLQGMAIHKTRWEENSRKYANICKEEVDGLFSLMSSPSIFIQQSIERLIQLWFNPLKIHEEEIEKDSQKSPSLRKRRSILIEPSVIIGYLISIADSLKQSMASWNRLIKYTYVHVDNLEKKVTDEVSAITFTKSFRDALFVHKADFLSKSFEELSNQIVRMKNEHLGRMAVKHMLQLRISIASLFHDAQLFSQTLPANTLQEDIEALVDVFLDQNFMSHLDLMIAMIRTADGDLMPLDFPSFAKQTAELLTHAQDVGTHRIHRFAGERTPHCRLSQTLKAAVDLPVCDLKPQELSERLIKAKEAIKAEDSVQMATMIEDLCRLLENNLAKESKYSDLKIDYSGSAVSSIIIAYYKQWIYFPEFSAKVKERLEILIQLFYFFNIAKLVSPVTLQFLLSGGFNLQELNSEDHFNQLENYHDIILFQKRYNGLRKLMKQTDTFIVSSKLPELKEKIQTGLTDVFKVANQKARTQDKLNSSLQKVVRIVWTFNLIDSFELTGDHSEVLKEIEDLLFYHILLNQTKDQQVFNKISKIKWEDVKETGMISDYASELITSIRNICSEVGKLGKFLINRRRVEVSEGKNWPPAVLGLEVLRSFHH